MQWLTSFLVWFFLSEAQAFEIPTNGLPEVSTCRSLLALAYTDAQELACSVALQGLSGVERKFMINSSEYKYSLL